MPPRSISIHEAAKRLTEQVMHVVIPKLSKIPGLSESQFDEDDDRWFFQTMAHRNAIVDAIKNGKIRALSEFALTPISYHKDIPETQPIRLDDFLHFCADLGFAIGDTETTDGGNAPNVGAATSTPPDPSPQTQGSKSVAQERQEGVSTSEIIDGFALQKDTWTDKLRHLGKYPAYKSALAQRGGRGKGRGGHTWNPAKFAVCLLEKKERNNVAALRATIARTFKDFLPEFNSLSEDM